MSEEVAVIAGVGPGLGWALAKRFAGAGMRTVIAARNLDKLTRLVDSSDAAQAWSGRMHPRACDVTKVSDVATLFDGVTKELGAPVVVVFNAGAFVRSGILETSAKEFERCWRIGCLGGFLVGQAAARIMVERETGTILYTGATASLRGAPVSPIWPCRSSGCARWRNRWRGNSPRGGCTSRT